MDSISSIKTIEGVFSDATLKRVLIVASVIPLHLLWIWLMSIEMKVIPLHEATACAKSVLPLPGGPYKRRLLHFRSPTIVFIGTDRFMDIRFNATFCTIT